MANTVSVGAAGCGGAQTFAVTASVSLGSFGTLSSAAYTVTLASFSALQLQLDAYPAGPTAISTLRKVQCTDAYQRATPHVTSLHAHTCTSRHLASP